MYDCFSLYTTAISTPVNGNQTIYDHCLPKLHAWILVAKIIGPLQAEIMFNMPLVMVLKGVQKQNSVLNLTKAVQEIDNHYSLQQDGRYCNMDNDNEVKVILPRDFFLTKTVKEIKCKPIVGLQIWIFFCWYTVLFENTATIRTKD